MTKDVRAGEAGFTLMEVLTVLAILALTVVISLPLLKTSGSGRAFRAEAQEISALFRLARIDAVSRNRETRIVVDLKNREIAYDGRAQPIRLAAETAIEVKTAQGEVVATEAGFRFLPGGGASGGSLTLERQGNRATIAVNWLTGAIAVDYGRPR